MYSPRVRYLYERAILLMGSLNSMYCLLMSVRININKVSNYFLVSIDIWHARLGHVNFGSLNRIVNSGLLSKCNPKAADAHKCEVCTKFKLVRKPFKSVERSNEVLGLIHTDLCDIKATPSRGGRNYYISFIDDCSKYCYV